MCGSREWRCELFGSEGALAVRLPFILLFAGSTWLMFLLTRRLFGAVAGVGAVVAFNLTPVFSVADASWVLPDGPLIFFLLAAAVVTERIFFADPAPQHPALWWLAAGVLAGLALLSKYSAIFFFASVVVFLVTTPGQRRVLASPGPWLGVLAAAVLFLPVVIWNTQNGGAGLGFQGDRFSGFPPFNAGRLLGNIGGQVAYLTPWLFVPLVYGLYRALRAGPRESRGWFVALQAILPVVVFTLLSAWVSSLPHWPMPGWLFAFPLLGREAARLLSVRPRLVTGTAIASAVLLGGVVGRVNRPVAQRRDCASDADRQSVARPDSASRRLDRSARGACRTRIAASDTVLAAGDWITASKASYAVGAGVPVLCLCASPHHFPFRAKPGDFAGRDVLVLVPRYDKRAMARLVPYFESLTALEPVPIRRAGETVIEVDLLQGHGLRPETAK